jgi:transposase InsO family protein
VPVLNLTDVSVHVCKDEDVVWASPFVEHCHEPNSCEKSGVVSRQGPSQSEAVAFARVTGKKGPSKSFAVVPGSVEAVKPSTFDTVASCKSSLCKASQVSVSKRSDDLLKSFEDWNRKPRCCMMQQKIEDGVKEKNQFEKRQALIEAVRRSECPDELKKDLKSLLFRFEDVFADKTEPVGLCEVYKPRIPLDTEDVIYTPQYPIPFKMRDCMDEAVRDFVHQGIVTPSTSPYNSPTIMVPKKDGGYRMVVDFRKLNKHVITDPHPLPRIQQILETLGGATVFSALDLLHGFYNLKIDERDRAKTAFSTHSGHFEFVRLPMGLKNSPAIFQRLMQIVLSGCLGQYAFIYIDDIILFSQDAKQHLKHLELIFRRLQQAGLKVKASKCQLFLTEIEYLGYLVGRDGLKVNPKKVKAISEFPVPKKVKDVQAFLGVVGYFRTFIDHFAERARPLYKLLKNETVWKWDKEEDIAFNDLKQCLLHAPVLSFPDFRLPFHLTTDASGYALGAILTQARGKKEVLISCASRTLRSEETRYSNTEREMLAVFYGVTYHRSYLWGNKVKIWTDNTAITHLARQMHSDNRKAIRWHMLLSEYDYELYHRKGRSMLHADALSRYPIKQGNEEDEIELLVHYISPAWQNEEYVPILDENRWRSEMGKLKEKDRPQGTNVIKDDDGLIYIKTRQGENVLWVPPTLREYCLRLFHDSPALGHAGITKMTKTMHTLVHWKNMHKDVISYVQTCEKCQRVKQHATRTPVRVMPIPKEPFTDISMDVVGPVPYSSSGIRYVLVIQDRLSRWVEFIPMRDASAETTAREFLTGWICRFGVPKKLVTDRGRNFMSDIFAEICAFLGVQHAPTTAYRPQGNAQNERSHQELHSYLALYLNEATAENWDMLLAQAAWAHNSSIHESLGTSPFEVITGLAPRHIRAIIPEIRGSRTAERVAADTEISKDFFGANPEKLDELRKHVKDAIARAQAVTLERLNKHTRFPCYRLGDKVLKRVHAYGSYTARKWSNKFDGPYTVIECIASTVFRIRLDSQPDYTDIVHAVYLRPYRKRVMQPSNNVAAPINRFPEVTDVTESSEHGDKETQLPSPQAIRTQPESETSLPLSDSEYASADDDAATETGHGQATSQRTPRRSDTSQQSLISDSDRVLELRAWLESLLPAVLKSSPTTTSSTVSPDPAPSVEVQPRAEVSPHAPSPVRHGERAEGVAVGVSHSGSTGDNSNRPPPKPRREKALVSDSRAYRDETGRLKRRATGEREPTKRAAAVKAKAALKEMK